MIRILIADDHPITRQGLKQLISEIDDFVVAGEAGTGQEALEEVRTKEYDLVLLDVSMPKLNGLEALKQIKIEKPDLPVLILSLHPEDQYALRALKAGASGYVTKASTPEQLLEAIHQVAAGKKYITPTLGEKLVENLQSPSDMKLPHELLSDREYQVLCLIAQGMSSGGIADSLYLSPKTVSTYRARILDKMKLNNTAEMMRYAIENNLVQ